MALAFYDSSDEDSLDLDVDILDVDVMSDRTTIYHADEPHHIRTASEINPDNLDLDLYIEDVDLSDIESDSPPPSVTRKPTTLEDTENQLVEACVCGGEIFRLLYLLHEHFSKSDPYTSSDKSSIKARIQSRIMGKVCSDKEKELGVILDNFFR